MGSQSEHPDLENPLITLNDTLQKDEGIVSTSSAERFLNQPDVIEDQYTQYARTHLVQPDVQRFIDNLVQSLEDPDEDRSIPGYIHGPYGYGKTSSAGKVWHVLEQDHGYIATPPIYFRDLRSIVDAVYGWMRHRLADREEHLRDLDDCYEKHAAENIEELLDGTTGDRREDVQREIEQLIEQGAIDVEFSVTSVLNFLSDCNTIAKNAGYNGLVVIADELQQFVSSQDSEKKAYAMLRDIAKAIALGLNDGKGLSLLFTMDDGLHSDLDVNADDVLARLSEQNATLNLSSVYGRSFPSDLWSTLSDKYGFGDYQHEVVTEDALDAIGQICERGPPISNGPRTVVDLFTTIIDHYIQEGTTFDALDLAESYYTGSVRYKGDKIKTSITQAINADIISSPDEENFIKLCGVFPRGVSDDRLRQYGLYEAKEAVKQDLHGQLLITHEEGRTLKSLSRDGEDRGLKDELFTQFYRQYDTSDLFDERAAEAFREVVLGEKIFESVRGRGFESWVTEHDFEPETGDAYQAIFRGTFDGQTYPRRIIAVRTGPNGDVVETSATSDEVDITLGFVTNMTDRSDSDPYISRPGLDEAILSLNFKESFDTLPSNIALLEDYMSPEDVNPHLLLCLHKYMESWRNEKTIDPSQKEQLDYIQDQLINQTIQQLFGPPINGDDLLNNSGSSRRTTQPAKVVEKVFSTLIAEVYPEYETLFVSPNYQSFLDAYISMLSKNELELRISQKRGNTSIKDTKNAIAKAFGVSSNSTIKTRIDKQYDLLVDCKVWSGQDAEITLTLHPLEKQLKQALEETDEERLSISEANEIGLQKGHRPEEVEWAIKLLQSREYAEYHPDEEYFELSDIAIDRAEVIAKFEYIEDATAELHALPDEWPEYDDIRGRLDDIEPELRETTEEDIKTLEEILVELKQLETEVDGQQKAIHAGLRERCRNQLEDIRDYAGETKPRSLNVDTAGAGVPFEMHLDDIQARLDSRFNDIKTRAEEAAAEFNERLDTASNASIDSITDLQELEAEMESLDSDLAEELEDIEDHGADYEEWCTLAEEIGDIRGKMTRYISSRDDPAKVRSLRDTLDDDLETIQREFQSDPDSTLRNAGVHREEFQPLRERFERIRNADKRVFNYRKNILENTLREATGGHATIRQSLSSDDPQGSRKNVRMDFCDQLRDESDGLNDLLDAIESVHNRLNYAELLNQIPADPEPAPATIRKDLDQATTAIRAIERAINQLDLQDDISLPEEDDRSDQFPKTDETLSVQIDGELVDIADRIQSQRDQVEEHADTVSRWRKQRDDPPSELEYIITHLDYRNPSDLESVFVKIAEAHNGEYDISEFFDDLQELFEGNHVQIKLTSEHR